MPKPKHTPADLNPILQQIFFLSQLSEHAIPATLDTWLSWIAATAASPASAESLLTDLLHLLQPPYCEIRFQRKLPAGATSRFPSSFASCQIGAFYCKQPSTDPQSSLGSDLHVALAYPADNPPPPPPHVEDHHWLVLLHFHGKYAWYGLNHIILQAIDLVADTHPTTHLLTEHLSFTLFENSAPTLLGDHHYPCSNKYSLTYPEYQQHPSRHLWPTLPISVFPLHIVVSWHYNPSQFVTTLYGVQNPLAPQYCPYSLDTHITFFHQNDPSRLQYHNNSTPKSAQARRTTPNTLFADNVQQALEVIQASLTLQADLLTIHPSLQLHPYNTPPNLTSYQIRLSNAPLDLNFNWVAYQTPSLEYACSKGDGSIQYHTCQVSNSQDYGCFLNTIALYAEEQQLQQVSC